MTKDLPWPSGRGESGKEVVKRLSSPAQQSSDCAVTERGGGRDSEGSAALSVGRVCLAQKLNVWLGCTGGLHYCNAVWCGLLEMEWASIKSSTFTQQPQLQKDRLMSSANFIFFTVFVSKLVVFILLIHQNAEIRASTTQNGVTCWKDLLMNTTGKDALAHYVF